MDMQDGRMNLGADFGPPSAACTDVSRHGAVTSSRSLDIIDGIEVFSDNQTCYLRRALATYQRHGVAGEGAVNWVEMVCRLYAHDLLPDDFSHRADGKETKALAEALRKFAAGTHQAMSRDRLAMIAKFLIASGRLDIDELLQPGDDAGLFSAFARWAGRGEDGARILRRFAGCYRSQITLGMAKIAIANLSLVLGSDGRLLITDIVEEFVRGPDGRFARLRRVPFKGFGAYTASETLSFFVKDEVSQEASVFHTASAGGVVWSGDLPIERICLVKIENDSDGLRKGHRAGPVVWEYARIAEGTVAAVSGAGTSLGPFERGE